MTTEAPDNIQQTAAAQRQAPSSKILWLLYPLPLVAFVIVWQLYTINEPQRQFIFSSPHQTWCAFMKLASNGDLLRNAGVTLVEALAGFILGTTCGAVIGLSLWYSKIVSTVSKPYITALGSIPIFALAPMIISWFGIGIVSKIALAFLSTVVVAIVQSYQGAMSVESKFFRLMQVIGANRTQTFKTVVLPSSLIWVVNAMKLNIGLALLGAFIGEFISAEQGLGHMIVRASGLYDMATVIVGVITLALLAICLSALIEQLERKLLPWRVGN